MGENCLTYSHVGVPRILYSNVKMMGFLKMPLFMFVVIAQFQALTAKLR